MHSIVIIIILVVLPVNNVQSTKTCRNTVSADEFEQHLRYLRIHWPKNPRRENISMTATSTINGRCEVPAGRPPVFLNHRSLCSWDIVRDVDENRYPPTLNVARCRCRVCLDRYVCEPVLYRMPVLQKRCVGDVLEYIKSYTVVSVGCTCARPKVRIVHKRIQSILHPELEIADEN